MKKGRVERYINPDNQSPEKEAPRLDLGKMQLFERRKELSDSEIILSILEEEEEE